MSAAWWRVQEREKPIASTPPPPPPDKPRVTQRWCRCDGTSTCLGCRIIGSIQRDHGTAGVMYLFDFLETVTRKETA